MKIPKFNSDELVKLLLNQKWQKECEIITEESKEDNKTKVLVKYVGKENNAFLRYSCGPVQGFIWDMYGDDMLTVEIAILAIHQAPLPYNYCKK